MEEHAKRQGGFAEHLPKAQSHIDQFVSANFKDVGQIDNLIKTLATSLTSVPGQDAPIQEEIAAASRTLQALHSKIVQLLQNDPIKILEQLLPHFVFHSTTLDKIPNEVNISEFTKNPEAVSRGMANLCGVAGLSMQKILDLAATTNTSMREGFEDHYRAGVSGGLNEFWTQETYTVHFRFDKEKMSISISDGTYSRRIAPTDRSDGFQWYLSFYTALINEVSQTKATIFLLDNPGLELHSDGQRDIKKFLEEKLPENAQVIYVTHSPAMIDPYDLHQIRQVELKGDMQGTKVRRLSFKEGADFDLLEPVRSAIGASLASSLVFNEFNILVEGAADKPILEGALDALSKDAKRKILVNGSVAESKDGFLVRFYQRARLPFIVCLDADNSGREIRQTLERWGVPPEKIIDTAELFPDRKGKDFELEDLLSVSFYYSAVMEAYPNLKLAKPEEIEGKQTKFYEAELKKEQKIGFNKRRVGEKVKALLQKGRADETTLANLRIVTDAVLGGLEQQVNGGGSDDRT